MNALELLCLEWSKLENGRNEFLWLLEFFLNQKISFLDLKSIKKNVSCETFLIESLKKRKKGFPFQYILKKAPFFDMDFYIEEGVLIPRFESEILVQACQQKFPYHFSILEVGFGSGAISICLKKNLPDLTISAIDINPKAFEVAKKNESLLLQSTKINWILGDFIHWEPQIQFDGIFSNPPYLSQEEYEKTNSLSYEPKEALIAEENGLAFYHQLAHLGSRFLKKEGLLIVENNPFNVQEIENIFLNQGFEQLLIFKDLLGLDRVSVFKLFH